MKQSANSGRRSRQLLRKGILLCVLWSATGIAVTAADPNSEESVKAAFVLRFAGYVEWPAQAVPERTFTIAVLGANEVAVRLQTLAAGRAIMNRPVQVRRIADIQDGADAQIVYVGADRRPDLRTLLATLRDRRILAISSEEEGLEAGSTINLLVADRHVRFEVSLQAAREARLRLSSELLALAVRVQR
ncbi:MAG: YfiR family protein [Steroidobacteraceae bacterium]